MADMDGQVVLVTGGIRGIGAAICDRLAARGMTIAAGYSRDKESANLFREAHSGSSVHQGDIGAAEDCERVIDEVLNQHGRLDVPPAQQPHQDCESPLLGKARRAHRPNGSGAVSVKNVGSMLGVPGWGGVPTRCANR